MYYWKAAIGTTQGIGTIDPSLHLWEKCLTGLSYKTVYDYHTFPNMTQNYEQIISRV